MLLLVLALTTAEPQLFLEREALRAADLRCRLLSEGAKVALLSGARQAEAALRDAGLSGAELNALAFKAQDFAAGLGCREPKLLEAASRAESAFRGWSNQWQVELPGRRRAWLARRAPDAAGFVLVQEAEGLRFGVRQGERLAQLAALAPPGQWSHATLWIRSADAPAPTHLRDGLAAPRRASAVAFLSTTRETSPAGGAWLAFSPAAAAALARLHPAETAELELSGPAGTLGVLIEAGDFAAGLAIIEAQGRRLVEHGG